MPLTVQNRFEEPQPPTQVEAGRGEIEEEDEEYNRHDTHVTN